MKISVCALAVGILLLVGFAFLFSRSTSKAGYLAAVPLTKVDRSTSLTPAAVSSRTLQPSKFGVRDEPNFITITDGRPSYKYAISLWAKRLHGMELSPEQIQQLQDIYSAIYEARIDYEVSQAKVGTVSSHERLIEIPSYSAFGKKLKETVQSMFQSALGLSLGTQVLGQLGPAIDYGNQSWGEYPQSILVSYDPTSNLYKITHSINPDPKEGPVAFQKVTDSTLSPSKLDVYSGFLPLFPPAIHH